MKSVLNGSVPEEELDVILKKAEALIGKEDARPDELFALIEKAIAIDPASTLNWINQFSGGEHDGPLRWMYGIALAKIDPSAALEFIAPESGRIKQDMQSLYDDYFIEGLKGLPIEEATKLAWSGFSGDVRARMLVMLFGSSAVENPQKTIEALESIPIGANKTKAIRVVAKAYSDADPKTAWSWAHSLELKEERDAAINGIISFHAIEDIKDKYLSLMGLIRDPETTESVTRETITRQAYLEYGAQVASKRITRERVMTEIEQLNENEANIARSAYSESLLRSDFEEATDFVAGLEEEVGSGTYSGIASVLYQQDPMQALEYAQSVRNPTAQKAIVKSTFRQWVIDDSISASSAISKIAVEARDAATEPVIDFLIERREYDSASAWAETLQSDDARTRYNSVIAEKSADP